MPYADMHQASVSLPCAGCHKAHGSFKTYHRTAQHRYCYEAIRILFLPLLLCAPLCLQNPRLRKQKTHKQGKAGLCLTWLYSHPGLRQVADRQAPLHCHTPSAQTAQHRPQPHQQPHINTSTDAAAVSVWVPEQCGAAGQRCTGTPTARAAVLRSSAAGHSIQRRAMKCHQQSSP